MTSPRVCLRSEPCQATLPARSQAPPGRLRQQAPAGCGRGVPTHWAGSRARNSVILLGVDCRLPGGACWGLSGDPCSSLTPWGWGI